jgi:hypothetical protein
MTKDTESIKDDIRQIKDMMSSLIEMQAKHTELLTEIRTQNNDVQFLPNRTMKNEMDINPLKQHIFR